MLADLEVGACGLCSTARCVHVATALVIHTLVVVSNPTVMAGWVALLVRAADGTSLLWPSPYNPEFQCSSAECTHTLPVIADSIVIGTSRGSTCARALMLNGNCIPEHDLNIATYIYIYRYKP